jgi:hypothetical protein
VDGGARHRVGAHRTATPVAAGTHARLCLSAHAFPDRRAGRAGVLGGRRG